MLLVWKRLYLCISRHTVIPSNLVDLFSQSSPGLQETVGVYRRIYRYTTDDYDQYRPLSDRSFIMGRGRGGGLQNEKITGPKLVVPHTIRDNVKLFCASFLKGWKLNIAKT